MSKKVAILHGWAGGRWHTKLFVEAMAKAGYNITKDASQADIIVAHSIGCFQIPSKTKAKGMLLMGPPYWPGKSIASRLFSKKRLDNKLTTHTLGKWYTFKKSMWEGIYIVIKPRMTLFAIKNHDSDDFLEDLKTKKVFLVRNKEDFFCSPGLSKLADKYANIDYVERDGAHDDFMTNPKPYIELLKKL